MKAILRWLSFLLVLSTLVACDHVTKEAAQARLSDGTSQVVMPSVLDLRYTENRDVAFNLLRWVAEPARYAVIVTGGAVAIAALAWALRRTSDPWRRAGLLLVLAGALGNYSDRLLRGYVIDFLHLPKWPVFNLADVWVTAGLVLLTLTNLRSQPATETGLSPPRRR